MKPTQEQLAGGPLAPAVSVIGQIPCINAGGCAIAALAMHRWAQVRGLKTEIVFLHNVNSMVTDNRKAVRTGDIPTPSVHVVVRYKRRLYDSRGMLTAQTSSWYGLRPVTMPEPLAVLAINEGFGKFIRGNRWNDTFDRDPNVAIIASRLNVSLSDVRIN